MREEFDDDFEPQRTRRSGRYRPDDQERSNASLCHLLAIFTGFVGPLIIWISHKDRSRFVDFHGREAINFGLNIFILSLVAGLILTVITIVTCGFGAVLMPLLFAVNVYAIVRHVSLMNTASSGQWVGYEAPIQLIGPPDGPSAGRRRWREDREETDDFPPEPLSDSNKETSGGSSQVWLWILGGLALVLVLCCVIGGIIFAIISSQTPAPTTKMLSPDSQPPMMARDRNDRDPGFNPQPPEPEPAADPVEQILQQLTSRDAFERRRAADSLAPMSPDHPRRAEVVEALAGLWRSNDPLTANSAARALSQWVSKDDVPLLIGLLDQRKNPSPIDRQKVIGKLAESKNEQAVKPLAEALRDITVRRAAGEGLKSLGSVAEDDLLTMLADRDSGLRREIIGILKQIGTTKSLTELEKLANDRRSLVDRPAREAIEAIKSRNR